MSLLPESEPSNPWLPSGSFLTKELSNGTLTLETTNSNPGFYSLSEEGFNNASGSTAEINVRLFNTPDSDHDACLFHLHDGSRAAKISFFNNRIEIFDNNSLKSTYYMDTTNDFHTYRLTIILNTFNLFVDGSLASSLSLDDPISDKSIMFGDGSITQNQNFKAQVNYIAYSTLGAFSPEGRAQQP